MSLFFLQITALTFSLCLKSLRYIFFQISLLHDNHVYIKIVYFYKSQSIFLAICEIFFLNFKRHYIRARINAPELKI